MVWKDTKKVGFGVSESKDGFVFVVAQYEPNGNDMGAFLENVDQGDYIIKEEDKEKKDDEEKKDDQEEKDEKEEEEKPKGIEDIDEIDVKIAETKI